jgi:hypothetical protein
MFLIIYRLPTLPSVKVGLLQFHPAAQGAEVRTRDQDTGHAGWIGLQTTQLQGYICSCDEAKFLFVIIFIDVTVDLQGVRLQKMAA